MLYRSLVYNRTKHTLRISAWARKTSQEIIQVRLIRILMIILFRNLYTPILISYTELQVLKVEDIF